MRVLVTLCLILLISAGLFWLDQPTHEPLPEFRLGVHLLMTGKHTAFPTYTWGEHLRYTRQMTGDGGWVAQVVQVDDLNIPKWQAFLEDCWALGLRPVLRLATHLDKTGHWVAPSAEKHYERVAAQWADFFADLHLPETVWVVIGNEPNSGGEWGGVANPQDYAAYLVAVAQALRRLEQPLKLAAAALDLYAPHTNGLPFPDSTLTYMDAAAFLDGMFKAQPHWLSYVDFWASHSYPANNFSDPPWTQSYKFDRINGAENFWILKPPPGIHNRGVNGYQWERWYLSARHGVKMPPLLITEFGYRHAHSVDSQARDKPGTPHPMSTIVAYLDMALWGNDGSYAEAPRSGWTPLADDPTIMGVVYFGLAGDLRAWGHSNLLRVDALGRVLGTYPHYDLLATH